MLCFGHDEVKIDIEFINRYQKIKSYLVGFLI